MFVGHIGVALAAKRVAPRTSLGTLFAAAVLLDLVWPILLLAGVEVVRIDPGNTAFTPLEFVHYAANQLGPPPPSARAVAVVGLAAWLLVPWSAYVDRHRSAPSVTA